MSAKFKFPDDYAAIRDDIKNLYRELNANPQEDRTETNICGYDIRLRRTRINGRIQLHLSYKPRWERTFHEVRSVLWLTELLYKYRGAA